MHIMQPRLGPFWKLDVGGGGGGAPPIEEEEEEEGKFLGQIYQTKMTRTYFLFYNPYNSPY